MNDGKIEALRRRQNAIDNPNLGELRKKVRQLPLSPGVYIMKNKRGEVIYVGKAKALRNRVSSYFRTDKNREPKVAQMVSQVQDFDTIVVHTESEALLLECSLIKQHLPKYNILLKDDKGFAYVRISPAPYSRITRELQRDEPGTYLGPYSSSYVVKETVEEVTRIFMLPTCKRVFPRDFRKERPCLNYHIHQCVGVCRGHIPADEYQKIIDAAVHFIEKGSREVIDHLTAEMNEAAENLEFERAARLRDRAEAVRRSSERQKVFSSTHKNADFIGSARDGDNCCFVVIRFRGGVIVDKAEFQFEALYKDPAATAGEFLERYYTAAADIPREIFVDVEAEGADVLALALTAREGHKVTVSAPQRGETKRLIDMAVVNAAQNLAHSAPQRSGREIAALDELQKILGLSKTPRVIESYDISNLGSSGIVAGMVVFENARPQKSGYRRFAIKNQNGPDDYAAMREVLERRFKRYLENPGGEGFGRLPDLILLDGGRGHVSAALSVLRPMGIDVPVFGMVKDQKHRTRGVTSEGSEVSIAGYKRAFRLITEIQDEVHRFAITYQKQTRSRSFELALERVSGLGPARAQTLFKQFKTLKAMRAATVDELAAAPGMTRPVAENLYHFLRQE